MKNFKEWYQLLSNSLLSARPFSFFYEESPNGELANQESTVPSTSPTSTTMRSSDTQGNNFPLCSQPMAVDISDFTRYSKIDQNSGLLTRVEALQINFLRLVSRIGQSPADPVVSQVLYRLQLASLIQAGEANANRPALKLDRAQAIASKLEAGGQADLDFSFKILILGRTGVGKSATINSIFVQPMVPTNAFQPATDHIQEITGTIKGIRVTVIDTPGLSSSSHNCRRNRKLLLRVKNFIRRSAPDVVLFLERLDAINRGYSDHRLINLITDVFGAPIWCNAIIGMTHCSSYPPEGPDGYTISYESYIGQHASLLQHYIHQTIGNTQLQNPVLLVENHSLCRRNSKGEKILPNGQAWMSQLLLLCTATKTLGDANAILRFQDRFQVTNTRTRMPSLPHLLSSLLHPRHSFEEEPAQPFDDVEYGEYDQLPPIRILTKAQYQKLSKQQKKAYLDELHFRETLYLKQQWNDEVRRRKENNFDNDEDGASQEVVQMPDITIPSTFDPACPGYRYRCLMGSNDKWLVRPVLNSQGWDHDVGFDSINLETSQELKPNIKASFLGEMIKDKEEFNVRSECAAHYTDANGRSVLAGIDIQTAEKVLVCSLHGDAKFKNFSCNKTGGGVTLTSFGKACFIGAKVEDSISVGRRLTLMVNGGRVAGHGQMVNGGSLEATLRGRDYPVRDDKLKLTASALSLEKETVLSGNLESVFCVGYNEKLFINASLNSRRSGQVSLKLNTTEHTEISLLVLIPLIQALFRGRRSYEPSNADTVE